MSVQAQLPAPVRSTPLQAPLAPFVRRRRVLGSLGDFVDDRLGFMDRCARQGDVTSFRLGMRLFHLLAHPDHVKHVLVDHYPNYKKETRGQELLKPVLGEGLLTAEGDPWRRLRRLSQPAFSKDRVASFAPIIARATQSLLDSWEPHASSGQPFEVGEEMSSLTLRIVGQALLSTDLADKASFVGAALTVALRDRTERSTSFLDLIVGEGIPTPRNLRFKRALKTLDDIVSATIAERRRDRSDRGDLLSILMSMRDEDSGEGMSDRLLRDQVMTMILAGHETTANALTWVWYLLSKNPAVERRARAEVETVLGGRTPTFEDMARLPYTRAVIDESMRLYPPIWTLARSVIADDVIGGYKIPAGSFVFMCPYVTQRHPAFWPNPEGFDPERFLGEAPADRPRFAYFPFGGGARQCIGNTFALLEATTIVAMTLQRYKLDLEPGHPVVPEPLMTLRPRDGVRVRLFRAGAPTRGMAAPVNEPRHATASEAR